MQRIEIIYGSETTTLAKGSTNAVGEPSGPIGLKLSGSVDSQMRKFIRGPAVKNTNRGNAATAVMFSVTYRFSSILEAQTFALVHFSTVRREGTLRFVLDDNNLVNIPDTVIGSVDVQSRGVRVDVSYSAVGGKASGIFNPASAESFDSDGQAMFDKDGHGMVFQSS